MKKDTGRTHIINPIDDPFDGDRKTPIPPPAVHLTIEQMMDLLIEILDTPEVRNRLAEVVIDVLRDRFMTMTVDRQKGSYSVLHPDVDDEFRG